MKKKRLVGEQFFPSLKKTLLIMRIAVILLLVGILQVHATDAYSQKTKLSINLSNSSLAEVFDRIEAQTEFYFLYNEKLIDTERKVNLEITDQRIEDVLKSLFAGTDVEYSIIDRKIILAPTGLGVGQQQPGRTVTGTVRDGSGQPIPGATVLVKGTTMGLITDINGKFSINLPDKAETLVFSFVGMKSQEVNVRGRATINVVMAEETIGIEEVVAIGYGTMKKSDLSGSSVSVSETKVKSSISSGLDQALQGRAAGVTAVQTSGQPGSSTSIRIRGTATLNADAEPLYVIDGVPISSSLGSVYDVGLGAAGGGGKTAFSALSSINPSDIVSMEILKDASATAIYGSRGANGVVLITTKRGKANEAKFTSRGCMEFKNRSNVWS